MIEAQISAIFPTPIYKAKLDRKFTEQELRFVDDMKTKSVQNIGNKYSANKYVLNHPSVATLKKEIDLFLEDYFFKILLTPQTISPYITQSWINYTETNEYHHVHSHPNSYLSGVLYINADKAHDKITFTHNRYDQIKLSNTKWNLFNSDSWFYPVGSGDIVIFPSRLNHLVGVKKGKNTRVSLSFNVFVKGNLDPTGTLAELKI